MLKKSSAILFILIFSIQLFSQILVTVDNEDAGFSTIGEWKKNNNSNYHNGTACHKDKGDGSAVATWKQSLIFPGLYKLETYNFNYKFGKDTQWKIKSIAGETDATLDMYYNPGWLELGEFEFGDSLIVSVSDYFESDTGTKVFADAIRLTSLMPLYDINTDVNPTGDNKNCDVTMILTINDIPLDTLISNYANRNVTFTGFPNGEYTISANAIGYKELVIDPVVIADSDVNVAVDLIPQTTLYNISGTVELLDENADKYCKTILYTDDELVAIDSVLHGENFVLPGIPEGNYTLVNDIDGYANIEKFVQVNNADIELDPVLLYPEFKFAWITDSHIGLSFTDPQFQQLVKDMKNCAEELDFIMHTGDLTEHGYSFELQRAADYLNDTNLPYYISIGNHDTKWSETGLRKYKDLFGDLYFSFDHKGFHFINLNDAITLRGAGGYFNPAQYEWLKNDLETMEDPNTPVIVMYHIPSSEDAVPNHWQITNILKDYRIAMIFTGHGHSNKVYNFDGLPGIMGMDTYNTGRASGFNVASISEKEIRITPYYNDGGKGADWHTKTCAEYAGIKMTFANIEQGATLTEATNLQVKLSDNATGGSWSIRPDNKVGSMTGSGKTWELSINPTDLENGFHHVKVTMMIDGGSAVYKTFSFYTENGGYPKAVWRFDAQDEILSKPAYDGDKVFFGSGKGIVYALNSETGELEWEKDVDDAVYSSPTVDNNILYIGTSSGTLYALNVEDGTEVWTYNSGKSMQSGIVVVDSLVYTGSGTNLIAVNNQTGELSWTFTTGGAIESRPAIDGDKIVCTSWDTKVYCLNRYTGSKKWQWGHQSSMYYSPGAGWPVIMNDLVFVVDPKKYMSCINLNTGAMEWQSDTPNVWDSIGKNEKGTQVYIRGLDGKLYAFNPSSTREELWSAPTEFGFDAKPSMPFGKLGAVFAGGSSGNLVCVSQATGDLKWIYHTAHTLVNSVTPKDGVSAYISCLDGTVAFIQGDPALDIKSEIVPDYENLLLPSYPNPFNNVTTIHYTLKNAQKVSVHIYDLLGKEVMKKIQEHNTPGHYSFQWNALNEEQKNLASGMYIVKLQGDSFTDQKKMLFLK